ncbi:Protein of unknown function [Amycolatopsis xylanica]|uniref:DUF3618 domain-containing protein n=1 Tax=Amycolatopsis xylanica TaxID=589385 RepID=A0A1H3JV59_9PSEU|nr:DUF3618 domain-containing protein [Amycolatopsis xylanica]SDY43803.1 Protein of unknown function [Amycolatopsis xylanica]
MSDFPKNAEEAKLDREVTRQELTETLEALGDKLDVKTRVKESVDEKLDQATAKLPEPAASKVREGAEVVRRNKIPVLAGFVGLLIVLKIIVSRSKS